MWPFIRKVIDAPPVNEVVPVECVQLWYVRWTRRHGEFSTDTSECMEAFPVEADAKRFADSLRAAFTLLRHTSKTTVTVSSKDH